MLHPLTHLGDISVEQFLAEYWQQKPLLIRQAFPSFTSPVTPEELAGFALEEGIESRLVLEQPTANPLLSHWQVEQGPLPETRFAQLPESHWTLLVQAVDQLVPDVGNLLDRFRFISNWRLDDVMVSYAADQGGVGPHFDYYDVFLLQAQGKRRWRLGQRCDSHSTLRNDTAMKILTQFDQQEDYLLEPGDMLYIPPNLAHWGTAEGACMTYSMGFRAPSHSELLLDLSEEVASHLTSDQRYSDSGLTQAAHPGAISPDAVERVRKIVSELMADPTHIAQWLASYGTRARRSVPELDEPGLPDATSASVALSLKHRIRSAYVVTKGDAALLYLDGSSSPCSLALAQALSGYQTFRREEFTEATDRELVDELVANQWLLHHQ